MLCTLEDVKIRLSLGSDTQYDDVITQIIAGVSAAFAKYTQRTLEQATITETLSGGSPWIRLKAYPVISITSIKEAADYDFAAAEALVANDEYRLKAATGLVLRTAGHWLDIIDAIQVVYVGGFVAAGGTPQTGEIPIPLDLREAAISQSTLIYKRRSDIGLSGVSGEGASFSKFTNYDWLPLVKETLDNYRRVSL